jgi:hypothetical protein
VCLGVLGPVYLLIYTHADSTNQISYFLGVLAWVRSSSHLLPTSFPSGHVPTQLLLFSPLINVSLKSTVLRTEEACQSVAQEINCASPRPHVSLIVFQASFKIVKKPRYDRVPGLPFGNFSTRFLHLQSNRAFLL